MKKKKLNQEEKSKKKIKNNTRGITLVALVVTIIVLLILAGVSIGLVFDSDGLFSKAKDAATKWNQAKEDEEAYLAGVMNDLEKYNGIYGGFYIGKYEAGTDTQVTSEDTTRKVLIQKNKYPYNYITIEDCKTKSINFANDNKYDNNKVYTKLASSYAWDIALCFIDKTVSNYSTNSGEYGNYNDHIFSDTQGPLNTGLTTPVCNIYDMGGNL